MADNRILFPQQPIFQVNRPAAQVQGKLPSKVDADQSSFSQLLKNELAGLKFSQHALKRMESRNIKLDQEELTKLSTAVDKAAQKGANESLILMNNLALVVSVKNRTVITAMDGASMKNNVFTNIDSAVIM